MTGTRHALLSDARIRDYRELVMSLVGEIDRLGVDGPVADAIAEHLGAPAARDVLARTGQTPAQLAARAAGCLREFRPRAAATARSAADEVSILLLQQIDLAWWWGAPDFIDEVSIRTSRHLIDMERMRRDGRARFAFTLASDRLTPRARNFAVRRWFPQRRPGTPGPSTPFGRPEMVWLLNAVADDFAAVAGPAAPALWINCMTRSVPDQRRLQELGFSAHYPSAHCKGWAADIEVAWFERFGLSGALVEVLEGYRDRGVLNAINEGSIWHVCPNPARIADFTPPTARQSGPATVPSRDRELVPVSAERN